MFKTQAITFIWLIWSPQLITNQLLYQLSYEGAKSFLVENIKLSKLNKGNSLCLKQYESYKI